MNTITLLNNDFKRILTHKEVLLVAIIIVPLFLAIAIFFSAKSHMVLSIAYVSDSAENLPQSSYYKVEVVKDRPQESALLMGKYSAIVEKKNGSYVVTTIKSKHDQEKIETFFTTGNIQEDEKRGVGTNILGYLSMIMMMQAVALTILFPEDRSQKTFRRILTAPVGAREYLFAQGAMTFLCLYLPTYLAIIMINTCFRIDIGYSLGMMAFLLAVLSAFSTAFALFISSLLERNTSLVASAVAMATCVLGGCFKSFTKDGTLMDWVFNALPQKDFMTLITGVEKGNSILDFRGQFVYLLIWVIALWMIGSVVTTRKVNEGSLC